MRTTVALLMIALAGVAAANGRPANIQSITFRSGDAQHVVAGATFGALVSTDGGASWRWMCEAAVGYGGVYDPDYAYTSSGAIMATTLKGLRVDRDGCSFELTALGSASVSQVEPGDGALVVHVAAADATDSTIYASADDAVTFPTSAMPGIAGDWWQSMVVAPSDRQRIYVSGYRIDNGTRVPLLFTSDNGGASFTPMTTSGMTTLSQSSVINIVGVAPTVPATVYALVTFENGMTFDGVYVSTNAGTSWSRLVGGLQPLAFLARANGELVVAGPTLAKRSTDGGASWTDLSSPPPISCLVERPDGVVWACVKDFTPGAARIMASADLASWNAVLRFADIAAPVDCPAGTVQNDACEGQWCYLRRQLSIAADPTGCDVVDGAVDGPIDAATADASTTIVRPDRTGCCESGSGSSGVPGLLLAALAVAHVASRRRRFL